MEKIPTKVNEVLEKLKNKYKARLSLRSYKNNFYLYENKIVLDPLTGKKKIIKPFYLGIITKTGEFIPAQNRRVGRLELSKYENARLELSSLVSEQEAVILRNLSMNARIPRTLIAKRIGATENTTIKMIENLTVRFNIQYIIEPNLRSLGFSRYLMFIKFEDKIPKVDEIKKVFENDPRVLLVATLNGRYDLLVYFFLETEEQLLKFVYKWQENIFPNYSYRSYITPFSQVYGGAVMREPFFELLKERVWHRTREQPSKLPWQLTESEYKVLKELNKDALKPLSEIALQYGLSGSAATSYIFERLLKRNFISRTTITMTDLPIKYYGLFFIEIIDRDLYYKHERIQLIKEELLFQYPWINKYTLVGDISIPIGEVYIAPILNENDFFDYKEQLSMFRSVKVDVMLITNILIGSIINRNFDNLYSSEYKLLVEEYGIKQEEKMKYGT
ncbi:MAG: hypothetical protein ACP5RQ_03345 [Candidatus Micrarchaeia archaeon]